MLIAGLGIGSAGLAAWMMQAGFDRSVGLASVAALFVGIAALAVSVADYLRRPEPEPDPRGMADDLARTIQDQWLDEARSRRVRDPRVLPLTWSATRREVADSAESVRGEVPAGRISRLNLDGRLDGRFDDAIGPLARGYQSVPTGRLVVLGEPGAGKTVLAMLLTLGLLDVRDAGRPVPVLLAAGSWDAVTEPLDDWLVRSVATTYYTGRTEIPRRLLARGLLLPIVDGLDEIPEAARRGAVRAINRAVGQDRPVVVTCRTAEYEDVIKGGAPVLSRAPVVEISPVPVADVVAYLSAVDWPDGTTWEAVYEHLRDHPDSPVAAALSTPLMVSMARMVYERCGGDPSELLDPVRFDSRHAVEDFLSDRVVDAAYLPDRLPSGQPVPAGAARWEATSARRWLAFLASYLHRHRERDIAWWQLASRLLSPWTVPLIAVGVGVGSMMAFTIASALTERDPGAALSTGVGVGGGIAVAVVVSWYPFAGRTPGRMSPAARGGLDRLRRGFATGLGVTAVPALPVLAIYAVASAAGTQRLAEFIDYVQILGVVAAVAVVLGLALAVHNWLDAPPVRSAMADPQRFLEQDRRSSLAGAVAAGAVVAVFALPVVLLGIVTGRAAGLALAGRSGRVELAAAISAYLESNNLTLSGEDLGSGLVIMLMLGAALGLVVLLTRAWPRFVIARVLLAARGQLPWRLMTFLADARQRGLLRLAGGTYQFRHARLQERLVDQPPGAPGGAPPDGPSGGVMAPHAAVRRRGLLVPVGVAVVAVALALPIAVRPVDASQRRLTADGAVEQIVFSATGRQLAVLARVDGADEVVQVWDVGTGEPAGEPVALHSTGVFDNPLSGYLGFNRDGDLRALVAYRHPDDDRVVVQDSFSGEPVGEPFGQSDVRQAVFDPDGRTVAVSASGGVQVREVGTGQLLGALTDGPRAAAGDLSMVFSPRGERLAIAGDDEVALWEVGAAERRTAETASRLSTPWQDHLVFSPDGRTVAGLAVAHGGDRFVPALVLWDAATGQLAGQFVLGIPLGTWTDYALAVSPDGRVVAVVGEDTMWLWDAESGRQVGGRLVGHTGSINDVAFSPDGATLATGSEDGTVRLWHVPGAGH